MTESCYSKKFPCKNVDKRLKNGIIKKARQMVAGAKASEESPGIIRQGCQLTAGGSDSKDSATEIYRQEIGKGGKVR